MEQRPTSTLSATEHAFRPLVLAMTFLCPTLSGALLLASAGHIHPTALLACSALSIAPFASNLHYLLTHELTTVGMIPVALSSLIPALAAMLCSGAMVLPERMACATLLLALIATAAVFCLWFCRLRLTYRSHPDVSPTACIIVLGGAVKQGRPHRTLAHRLDVAARYWHEQPTRTIVVSGGPTPDQSTTEADVMASYLQQLGVNPARIMVERMARNTDENIRNSIELLEREDMHEQLCVVSSDYHLHRALRDARKLGVSLAPIAAPTPPASVPQQWCREVMTILSGR